VSVGGSNYTEVCKTCTWSTKGRLAGLAGHIWDVRWLAGGRVVGVNGIWDGWGRWGGRGRVCRVYGRWAV
jgi:hypothetical protein